MNNLYLRVSFLAGTSLQAAYDEAKKLSEKLDCVIEFSFNNIILRYYGQSYDELDQEYFLGTVRYYTTPSSANEDEEK